MELTAYLLFLDESFIMKGMGKHVFGPVPSRRLGFSLGVDIIPAKYCSFDCVYCQIGKTTNLEIERRRFFEPRDVVKEVVEGVKGAGQVDYITFSGSGEPTLNSDIGLMIREIKREVKTAVAVITNGSLLNREDVRRDLAEADVVLPSLDAASEDIFHYINRPHPLIDLAAIIEGLKDFRKEYRGLIWLEIMLMRDVNDDPEELKKFKDIIEDLEMDRIHLNTVTRPPSEEVRGTLGREALEMACAFLGDKCEVICTFGKSVDYADESEDWEERVLEILKRRSMNLDDIVKITGVPYFKVKSCLSRLEREGVVKSYHFGDTVYYLKPED
jgi:wyosine [tRNA(Phe)-imidazoG37] synthetase (radical SAM superfamily)